jgi:hypothetical protein
MLDLLGRHLPPPFQDHMAWGDRNFSTAEMIVLT